MNDWSIKLKPSWFYSSLIVGLYTALCGALFLFGEPLVVLLPLAILAMIFHVMKNGLLRLQRSVVAISWRAGKWYLILRNQQVLGPFQLAPSTQLEHGFIRLSLNPKHGPVRHQLLTTGMVGQDQYRRLKVFLRWWPHR